MGGGGGAVRPGTGEGSSGRGQILNRPGSDAHFYFSDN